MRYFIVDDDPAFRAMLSEIIEDEDLGEIVGEAADGAGITAELLTQQDVDILLLDLLMPGRDGLETIKSLALAFTGKIIMISQVESKQLIGEAYALGIEYYITKPLNRLEVLNVLHKVHERLLLEKSIKDIQNSLHVLSNTIHPKKEKPYKEHTIINYGRFLLSQLGILGESGSKDLLSILEYLFAYEKQGNLDYVFPPLKDIFLEVAKKKLGPNAPRQEIHKEIKAAEQRIRRAIYQALIHIASLGLADYTNPVFENYATKFFDFSQVRKKMRELENDSDKGISHAKINPKNFIQVLYWEAKQLIR